MRRLAGLVACVASVYVAAACAPVAGGPSAGSADPRSPDVGRPAASPADSPPAASGTARVASRPAYLSVPLTDVRTGETFTLGQFTGKVAIVQAMAVW
ncbi:MAG TPA: hypothetical protein VFM93_08110 [Candidatus Limnocylindria bacterium]|nr:hypothetical protein [Candidatus Limnocylindria bacterium]